MPIVQKAYRQKMIDDTDQAAEPAGRFEAFTYPAYVKYWTARFVTTFAT